MKTAKTILSLVLAVCLLGGALPGGAALFTEWLGAVPFAHALTIDFPATPTDATYTDATFTDATETDAEPKDPSDYLITTDGTPYRIDVRSTGHVADRVRNYGGYASVRCSGETFSKADREKLSMLWNKMKSGDAPSTDIFEEYLTAFQNYDDGSENPFFYRDVTALISPSGKTILPYTVDELYELWDIVQDGVIARNNTDVYVTQLPVYGTGYYDLNGNKLFEADYRMAKPFSDGVAFVRTFGSKNGLNELGEKEKQNYTEAFLINKKGEVILNLGEYFNHLRGYGDGPGGGVRWVVGNFGAYSEGLIAFSNTSILKNNVTDPADVNIFSYDYAYCGYADLKGNIIIPQQYYEAYPFYEGLAAVQQAKTTTTYYYFDENGRYIETDTADDGQHEVYTDRDVKPGKFGFIDKEGNTVIPFIYDSAYRFCGDYAVVSKDGKYGVINRNNETVVPFAYDIIFGNISDGIFLCEDENGAHLKTLDEKTLFTLHWDAFADVSDYDNGVLYYTANHELYAVSVETVRETGDVDGDGVVTPADARLALRASVKLEYFPEGLPRFLAADVNSDGRIAPDDARTILRAAIGLVALPKAADATANTRR